MGGPGALLPGMVPWCRHSKTVSPDVDGASARCGSISHHERAGCWRAWIAVCRCACPRFAVGGIDARPGARRSGRSPTHFPLAGSSGPACPRTDGRRRLGASIGVRRRRREDVGGRTSTDGGDERTRAGRWSVSAVCIGESTLSSRVERGVIAQAGARTKTRAGATASGSDSESYGGSASEHGARVRAKVRVRVRVRVRPKAKAEDLARRRRNG